MGLALRCAVACGLDATPTSGTLASTCRASHSGGDCDRVGLAGMNSDPELGLNLECC
jgi:hypothetical protein